MVQLTHVSWNRVHNDPSSIASRSSKVVDFGTDRMRVCDFLLAINSRLLHGPILPRFKDITAFVRRKPPFPYRTLIPAKISGVPFGADPWCWGL